MTRDEAIRMAQEAGWTIGDFNGRATFLADGVDEAARLMRFAEIAINRARHTPGVLQIAVRALEQERARGYREGVAAEREACAALCESRQTPGTGSVAILNGAADAIRARGAT